MNTKFRRHIFNHPKLEFIQEDYRAVFLSIDAKIALIPTNYVDDFGVLECASLDDVPVIKNNGVDYVELNWAMQYVRKKGDSLSIEVVKILSAKIEELIALESEDKLSAEA